MISSVFVDFIHHKFNMMICQVARGMERLEALGIVHRDLAARWKNISYHYIIFFFIYCQVAK